MLQLRRAAQLTAVRQRGTTGRGVCSWKPEEFSQLLPSTGGWHHHLSKALEASLHSYSSRLVPLQVFLGKQPVPRKERGCAAPGSILPIPIPPSLGFAFPRGHLTYLWEQIVSFCFPIRDRGKTILQSHPLLLSMSNLLTVLLLLQREGLLVFMIQSLQGP